MTWEVALFIALPLGFIIGNIMLVKHTAKMKMPSLQDHQPDKKDKAAHDSANKETDKTD
ncbi:DUF2897 family protein [Lacimicrobium sp. SS2-24]|uniref:DUF2897 family protein n=1 Tax=Lacimicrobium sp. SS2-24 TaxID=2005569 RepID=UPI000B4B7159|nr:DUF2897 family protein [Lacimicrobium sp. SS2-24]